ncbi:hypothetical protein [Carboxylicivirga sp. RSCT41]|uniref:hypothetical protein n=1 Tax=Carboxylicivirga agarovorans TaxID=3417570 RepID=UPI003D32C1CD
MIEIVRLYWKIYRWEVAIIVASVIFVTTILLPLSGSEPYDFWGSLIHGFATIGFYVIMTPFFMIAYHFYKKQQIERNPGYKIEMPEIFTLDNFLSVFTVYSAFGFIAGLVAQNIIFGK